MFCGATIKPIKICNTESSAHGKIIVSTCYFHNSYLFIDRYNGRNLEYLDGLIANIETFDMKIQRFTSTPENWIYRVYIDETVLEMTQIMNKLNSRNVITKTKSLKNKSNNNIINELDYNTKLIHNNIIANYDIFVFLETLLKKYINKITESRDSKYRNIEIFTYKNADFQYKLLTNPKEAISGMIETYGTLLRYHPLVESNNNSNISTVIMRNCSHNLTPIDIMIQNYWIMELPDKEFMEYVDINYDFTDDRNLPQRLLWYKTFYHKSSNSKHEMANKIKHFGYDRIMAGLISCKLNRIIDKISHNSQHYSRIFEDLYNKIKQVMSGNIVYKIDKVILMFDYGIDEAIINFIFPELRIASYRKEIKDKITHNTKTFAIQIINGANSSCNKCDKPKFEKILNEIVSRDIQKLNIKSSTKKHNKNNDKNDTKNDHKNEDNVHNNEDNINSEEKTSRYMKWIAKFKNKCCLYDIYKNENGYKNMPPWMQNKNFYYIPQLKYLDSKPFVKLNINTWQIPSLGFYTVLSSIMFTNVYNFAIRSGSYNIPLYIKRSRTKFANHNKISNKISNRKSKRKSDKLSKKPSKKPSKKLEYDNYLILCNVKNPEKESEKYIEALDKAYNHDNFNPILIYPKQLIIFNYSRDGNTKLRIENILKPIENKHGFIFKHF